MSHIIICAVSDARSSCRPQGCGLIGEATTSDQHGSQRGRPAASARRPLFGAQPQACGQRPWPLVTGDAKRKVRPWLGQAVPPCRQTCIHRVARVSCLQECSIGCRRDHIQSFPISVQICDSRVEANIRRRSGRTIGRIARTAPHRTAPHRTAQHRTARTAAPAGFGVNFHQTRRLRRRRPSRFSRCATSEQAGRRGA
jgi:hypothetical protein